MARHSACILCGGGLLLLSACQGSPVRQLSATDPPASATVAALAPAAPAEPDSVALQKRAKGCSVPHFRFQSGGVAAMETKNDGNWCWVSLRTGYGGPFTQVVEVIPPSHGVFSTAPVGAYSRLSYKPNAGFSGQDSFKVDLQPGANSLTINVTVD